MPDPIDELENFTLTGTPMNPLPAAQVRRRGNRIRRRNNALATVGGLAVVAIIATPFAIAAGGGQESDRSPAPIATRPVTDWVTAIPAGFPLGAGMGTEVDPPQVGHERGEVVFSSLVVCGKEVWTPDNPTSTDALGAVWSDGVEGGEQRTLALYPTDREAEDALAVIRSTVESCPNQARGRGDYIQPVKLPAASSGDDALAYMDQYGSAGQPTGEANAFVITRVGNALLLDKTYFGGGGSLQIAQQTVDLLENRSARVVDAMCDFAVSACVG